MPSKPEQGHKNWVCPKCKGKWSNPLPVLTAQCQVCYPAKAGGNRPAMVPDQTKGK